MFTYYELALWKMNYSPCNVPIGVLKDILTIPLAQQSNKLYPPQDGDYDVFHVVDLAFVCAIYAESE